MNDLFIKNFNDEEIITLIFDDRICWIAKDIAKILGYDDSSKAVNQCIKSEKFESGVEYEVLVGDKLKELKKLIGVTHISYLKQTPKLVIFYEEGLYGFINYSELPLGVSFRKWLRREVLPEIRETGSYSINNDLKTEVYEDKHKNNLTKKVEDKLKKLDNLNLVLEVLNLVDKITSKDNENKLKYIKDILDV